MQFWQQAKNQNVHFSKLLLGHYYVKLILQLFLLIIIQKNIVSWTKPKAFFCLLLDDALNFTIILSKLNKNL